MANRNKAAGTKRVAVDFPKANETISALHYAVRITAEHGAIVEASLDDAPYSLCHHSAGHWWHHLHGLSKGPHKIIVKATNPKDGSVSVLRRFRARE